MIIGRSTVALTSAYRHQVEQSRTERLRAWDDRGTKAESRPYRTNGPADGSSQTGPALAAPRSDTAGQLASGPPATYAKFAVMIALVERLTGRKVIVLNPADLGQAATGDPSAVADSAGAGNTNANVGRTSDGTGSAPQAPPRRGWGIDYQLTETRREQETIDFSATGQVTTADGRDIAFSAQVTLDRESTQVTDVRVRAGDALTDPLVLNFGSGPVSLAPSKIAFDLNADGVAEHVSFVAQGNGFLVLDANGNGRADDGRELFGPATGDGFAELARYDQDGNGWIDEGDAVYGQLRIWDAANGQLSTLAERGVGAIGLGRVATAFTLDAAGQTAGVIRTSGVWLRETGEAGTVHQIDLTS